MSIHAQQALLAQIAGILPALAGRVEPVPCRQLDLAASLLEHWQRAQPAAGRAYWTARSWSMLIWQPAYLSVLTVHCGGQVLDLAGMQQVCTEGSTAGFTLPPQQPMTGETGVLLQHAAAGLLAYRQAQLPQLQAIQPYSAHQASCLMVDCVLSALQLAGSTLGWPATTEEWWAGQWLGALQLTRHGRLMRIEVEPGRCRTALERQGCCQHFRIPGAVACSTCPRWPLPERLQLIRQEWQHTQSCICA
ncbi:siderophore ferric iron reductase [Chitinilyticum piscinae]|uniref:Siderophore ferric iron reductase n=1 Tax=Chitinilyticum piscinae TaxID=2866724 RepID=A0A8J7FK41_9NEIS|nr:siderophore ferric iron reductase [Chitinilyticum piscinae]MBE9610638.1 siderophore ferric iron reductase [Chitinilyticum piscinae]